MTSNTMRTLGFGAMRLSELDEPAALRLIHEALDRGIRFFDTADVYAPDADSIGHNERLLAKALARRSDGVVVGTKGGLRREGKKWMPDGRAKHLKAACEASLRSLGVDCLDLYQLHAIDPKVPLETSVRALASLKQQGKVRDIGLCNVRVEEIEAARGVAPIDSVQVDLSVLSQTPLKNGVVRYCLKHGVRVIAHSPLGGRRRVDRVAKLPVLQAIAKRRGVSAHEVALAWLWCVEPSLVPIPGATRMESLVSSVHASEVTLSAEDVEELDAEWPAGAIVRRPPATVPLGKDAEVVLFVGYPGAGKTTLAEEWVARGYTRLSRDEQGGTLAGLVPELERRLTAGERRLVLDNTYPRRESRFDVIETARRHRVPVRCLWLETTLEQAQVNAVTRMIARHGRLLAPDEMRASPHANDFTPDAQFRYRRELEPPREDEGFAAIDRVPFARREVPRAGRAVFVDALGAVDVLKRYAADGYRIVQLSYQPGGNAVVCEQVRVEGLVVERFVCTHPPGRAVCWCRKPLPGHGVLAIDRFELEPALCIVVGESAADRGFAARLGCRVMAPDDFYRR